MNNFNKSLDKSLQLLYDYSSNFQISIELIQKLAQHLKLETYIDTTTTPQRLTIAGSSILLDLDFENEKKVVDVSLSISGEEASSNGGNTKEHISSIQRDNTHGITIIKLNTNQNHPVMFMTRRHETDAKSVVESILLDNLSQVKLGQFPINLQYLANIDKYSNSIEVIEKIALLFYTINQLEVEKQPDNWQIQQGLVNSVGLVKIHDIDQKKIGLFLEFWQDFRFINHESDVAIGNKYNIQFTIIPSTYNHEYLSDNKFEIGQERIKFEFEDVNVSPEAWLFNLVLNHSIYIPTYILEYLGLEYTQEQQDSCRHISKELYEKFNQGQDLVDSINILDTNVSCSIINKLSINFIPLKTIKINRLSDIPLLISTLRNFVVLTNLYRSLLVQNNGGLKRRKSTRRRRSSRISNDKELTEEIRKKLKQSLKLPNDVTDEELLGLNAISETATYSTIQPINNNNTLDLESFLNNNQEENLQAKQENYFQLSLDEIDVNSNDLYLTIEAYSDIKEIFIKFKISNGEIKLLDEDLNENNGKFIKILNLTEDFMVAITSMY
ncbi:hypothetical protein JA1_000773 [Spathaspora sp. JA1]|nr:hypothetical protein JA1_000773 [Spathaspora sp. JA1]